MPCSVNVVACLFTDCIRDVNWESEAADNDAIIAWDADSFMMLHISMDPCASQTKPIDTHLANQH